jgi:hypothetical protein
MIRDDADIDEEIEIQMAKERRLREVNERQVQMDIYEKRDKYSLRKHASVPSNFSYDLRSASSTSNIAVDRTSLNGSRHSINLPTTNQRNAEVTATSCHDVQEQDCCVQPEREAITRDSNSTLNSNSQEASSLDSSFSLKARPIDCSSNSIVTDKALKNCYGPYLDESFRRRDRQINEIKQIQDMIRNSTSSYKTHFSPRPSVRIKNIDETDTDN